MSEEFDNPYDEDFAFLAKSFSEQEWMQSEGQHGFLTIDPMFEGTPLSPQQVGVHLFETLFHLSECFQEERDDDVLSLAMQTLELHLNVLFEAEAQLVLYGHEGLFFLNKTPLHMSYQERKWASRWWRVVERKGLGGFMLMGPTTHQQSLSFFEAFLRPDQMPEPTNSLYPLPLHNAQARIASFENEQLSLLGASLSDPVGHAVLLYARLLQWVRQRYNPLSPRPRRRDALRILKGLSSLTEGRIVRFLGFRGHSTQASTYQPYHIANTAVLAMLFGSALRLTRSQQLELALSTLEHEIGKLDLPPELLQKSAPLSAQEQREIELLPVRTVHRLLGDTFRWKRLKQALIAVDVGSRLNRKRDNRAVVEQTLLFSRIIGLCSCFDALCSERPFRAAMRPTQARSLMQGALSHQFDSVLLDAFVRFIRPAVVAAMGRSGSNPPSPGELRKRNTERPQVMQQMQEDLRAYRALRQKASLTSDERSQLDGLKSGLIEHLKSSQE
jgi:HD-GYP domain-containing protein (c-di-GMP phosphodiesterase class II)